MRSRSERRSEAGLGSRTRYSVGTGELHADYHQVGDEVGRIDIEHMTALIRGIYGVGLEFANRADRPEFNAEGLKTLEAMKSRRR